MVRKILTLSVLLVGVLLMGLAAALAADYSTMSTEELAAMRGTMQQASEEERRAFQQEWQNRLNAMTPEERQRYEGLPGRTQPRLHEQQMERERQRLRTEPGMGYGQEPYQEPGIRQPRERLTAPPESMGPRRFGQESDAFERRRRQIGPPRYSPTPDFSRQPSPFGPRNGSGAGGNRR